MGYGREVLAGEVAVDLRPDQRSVFDHLMEVWDRGQKREELLADLLSMVTDEDAALRSAAVEFFAAKGADDAGALLDALVASPALYEGVLRQWYAGDADLKALILMQCARGGGSSDELFEIATAGVVVPEYRPYALQVLMRFHEDWVLANLSAIADGSPDALRDLLYAARLCGKLPDPFLLGVNDIPEHEVLALVEATFAGDLTRITWLFLARADTTAPAELASPVWSVRVEGVRAMAGNPAAVPVLAHFSAKAMEGCEELDCPAAEGQDESIRRIMCMTGIRAEIVSALAAAGETEVGLYALLDTARDLFPSDAGEACARALMDVDAQRAHDFAAGMLSSRRIDVENIGGGIAAVGTYFDGSATAVSPLLKKEPPPLPQFLALLRENDIDCLRSLASGSAPFASRVGDLLKVMAEY